MGMNPDDLVDVVVQTIPILRVTAPVRMSVSGSIRIPSGIGRLEQRRDNSILRLRLAQPDPNCKGNRVESYLATAIFPPPFHVTSPHHSNIMTTEQRELVKATFAQVAPISEVAADLFYNRLFELDPTLRPMFTTDLKEQGRKLMQMLAMIVGGLDRLDTLTPAVEDLGRRHVSYAVRVDHYQTVGAALIWTLERGLGDAFTDDVRDAWIAAFALLTTVMTGAAAGVESEPAAV